MPPNGASGETSTAREPQTLAELVAGGACVFPQRVALIFEERSYTYGELDEAIERATDAFALGGVRRGDRVALMLANDMTFVTAFYGLLRLGAIAVPINAMYKTDEVAHVLGDCEPSLALVDWSLYDQAGAAFRAAPLATAVVAPQAASLPRGTLAWSALLAAARLRVPSAPLPSDGALLVYTSGTTGRAKGALHTHESLLANCRQGGSMLRRSFSAGDRALVSVPLSHIYALQSGFNQMFRVGGSVVLLRRFDALGVLDAVARYRCTFLLGAPPMFVRWSAMPELRASDLSSLRVVTCGTAPLAAPMLRAFAEATGVAISESYGLTEAGPTTHSNSNGPVDKPGSIGPPIPGVESRLVDVAGRDVAPGEPGEIVVRSPGVMREYWRNPAATAEALRDGWLHTGDVAIVDADGYYRIVDRLKDMISAGGYKIWPREVEETLAAHPAVADVAVVGMPDADLGERPVAFVVLHPGATVSAAELSAFVAQRLAKYKVPARFELVAELPRVGTGKVLRRELRERARTFASSSVTK